MDLNYFEDRPHDVAREHRRRINLQIHERFHIRDTHNPLNMSVTEFVKLYRMPQHDVVNLCNLIRLYVPQRRSPQQTPLIRKLLVALSFYACGSYQRMLGRSIDVAVGQSTVSRSVREITEALTHPDILQQFIRFPLTHEEREAVIMRNDRLGLPRVLGILDGFLVRLSYLPRDRERQSFYSRKGWLALNIQLICDADLNILSVDSRWPGSLSDNMIWSASAARRVLEDAYREDRCWLLGDSGYFLAPWMHVPMPHAAPGTPEYYYTQLHCHVRNVVERTIGVLKARWRLLCVDRCVNYRNAEYAGRMVLACSVLHNYCNQRRIPQPPPFFDDDRNPDNPDEADENDLPFNVQQRALKERQFLINHANQQSLLNRNNIVAEIY